MSSSRPSGRSTSRSAMQRSKLQAPRRGVRSEPIVVAGPGATPPPGAKHGESPQAVPLADLLPAVLAAMPAIYMADLAGTILYANPAYHRLAPTLPGPDGVATLLHPLLPLPEIIAQ